MNNVIETFSISARATKLLTFASAGRGDRTPGVRQDRASVISSKGRPLSRCTELKFLFSRHGEYCPLRYVVSFNFPMFIYPSVEKLSAVFRSFRAGETLLSGRRSEVYETSRGSVDFWKFHNTCTRRATLRVNETEWHWLLPNFSAPRQIGFVTEEGEKSFLESFTFCGGELISFWVSYWGSKISIATVDVFSSQ